MHRSRHSRIRGRGKVLDWFKNAGRWIKKHKILSRGSTALGHIYPSMNKVSQGFQSLGLGRKRRVIKYRRR